MTGFDWVLLGFTGFYWHPFAGWSDTVVMGGSLSTLASFGLFISFGVSFRAHHEHVSLSHAVISPPPSSTFNLNHLFFVVVVVAAGVVVFGGGGAVVGTKKKTTHRICRISFPTRFFFISIPRRRIPTGR